MYDNDKALTIAIINDFCKIIDTITDKLLEKLKEIIEEVVYNPYEPKKYERQGLHAGLLGEWERNHARIVNNTVVSEIFEAPYSMSVNPDNFIHGSLLYDPNDIREFLAEIVITGKSGRHFDFAHPPLWWRSPRDFWTPFVQLLSDGTVDSMIEREMKKRGIRFIKG